MTSLPTYIVFEVRESHSSCPSSYLQGNYSEIESVIEKVLHYYNSRHCPVEVLMGNSVEDLTQAPVVSVNELFRSVSHL